MSIESLEGFIEGEDEKSSLPNPNISADNSSETTNHAFSNYSDLSFHTFEQMVEYVQRQSCGFNIKRNTLESASDTSHKAFPSVWGKPVRGWFYCGDCPHRGKVTSKRKISPAISKCPFILHYSFYKKIGKYSFRKERSYINHNHPPRYNIKENGTRPSISLNENTTSVASVTTSVISVTAVSTVSNIESKTKELLDWTSKQGRILTANGKATSYYTNQKGFPFQDDELPHYHLQCNTTHVTFSKWAKEQLNKMKEEKTKKGNLVCGVWKRPLFVGGWEHSTEKEERVFNVQTNTLFIDLRIPLLANELLPTINCDGKDNKFLDSIRQFTNDQLQLYSRRHVFGGYTVLKQMEYQSSVTTTNSSETTTETTPRSGCQSGFTTTSSTSTSTSQTKHNVQTITRRPVCTRHHCIDWNFVGVARPRPNKWFVEMMPPPPEEQRQHYSDTWKEWAFAKDDLGQHYYWERWERLPNDGGGNERVLALRKISAITDTNTYKRDGILVIVGDHFNYLLDRDFSGNEKEYPNSSSLIDLVDTAIAAGDRETAESYLSIDAGHGTISSGWEIDCAIQYWKEGTKLFSLEHDDDSTSQSNVVRFEGTSVDECKIVWGGYTWEVYESSITDMEELRRIFRVDYTCTKKRKRPDV